MAEIESVDRPQIREYLTLLDKLLDDLNETGIRSADSADIADSLLTERRRVRQGKERNVTLWWNSRQYPGNNIPAAMYPTKEAARLGQPAALQALQAQCWNDEQRQSIKNCYWTIEYKGEDGRFHFEDFNGPEYSFQEAMQQLIMKKIGG